MGDEEDSNPRKICRDEITKADEEEQTAAKKPCVTTSEGLTDDAAEQHETSNVDKLGEEQLTRKEEESISEEDEGEMRKDQEKDTLSLQVREEQGDAESVNEDTSVREIINDRNINTGVKCAKLSKVKTGDKEVQDNLFMNEDSTCSSSTEENTNDKSEELKETKVDDAPVNVEEQLNNSSEQHLDEETKTEKQKQTECQKPAETNSEDLTDKVKEEQGEDIGLEEQKGEELENKNVSKRDTDDEENTQIGHSEEDDGQMGKDQEKDTVSLQAGGEEGDEESVKKDTSVRETSYYRNTNSDEDCEKQKLLNSEDEEVQENIKSMGSTYDGKSMNQSYTMKSSGDHDDSRFNCSTEENETQCILQVRGEQGEKKDTSDRETINDRNINTGVKCATLSKVKTSGDKEVQDNGFINEDSSHSSSTEENTNEKSEELKETKVDDAPVNVGKQKRSSEQHLNKKTKTVKQKQRVIQPQRVHYGLHNQGATCYLNSVLQVLFMTPEVHDRFNSELKTELNRVFAGLKKRTCGTENITRILKIKNVYEQGDAAECLELILNKISQQYSEEIQGRLMYTTKCSEGHIINKETSLFWTLPLSLPLSLKDNHDTTYSVERSFERIFQRKIFNGDNKVHCNECNYKTEATKECEMEKYPPILTVLLKRFDFDYRRMSHFKSDCCVDVPLELKRKNQMYKLYGMVKHMGSLTGGHYTATILSNEDQTWYECNDSYVRKVEQLFEKGTYKSRTVYLLMYRECQKPAETGSEDLKGEVKEVQGEDIGLEELKREEGENNNVCKRDTDDEDNTQMGHSEEDEGQMRKDQEKHAFSLQARGEEGDEESVKKDTSVRETINDRHMSTDEDCEKQNKLINSEDEEVQDNLFVNEDNTHSSSTEENTNDKSEELMETKVDDAPVNVGEQLNNSSEQHLNEETKTVKQKQTECQKPAETNSEDLTDKVKEEQGEDIGLEEQKGEELENKNVSKRDTDDEENTQIGHSEEDDGQMGKDQEKDTLSLQAGGEEGDEESVKKDTSVRETSYYRNTNSDKDCEKQKLLNSEDEEVQENLKSMGSTFDGKSANQSYSMKSSGDHDDSRFNCSAEENETQCILQVRGEQGEKKDTSDRETINDRNINTGVKCATLSKVKTSGDKEVQDNGFINEDSSHSSSTEENTNEKSEELKETKVDDAPVNVEEQVKYSSDQHLDEETKTERQKQTECQKPAETSSEDLKDEVKEEQGEDIGLEEQKGEEGENNNVCKRDTDDEDNTQMGHSEEDEGQMRKDQEKHAFSLQARGEEGDEESVKKDTSVRETINDRHMSTDEDCEKQNKLINSEDEEVQETLFVNENNTHSSSTEENTNDKSEELMETKVDDAPVNVGEQLNNSSEQHLNEETKTVKQKQTECQKPAETNSEDLTDKVKEEQGEDIGLEEQKGEELENKNVSKRDTDDEENTQIGHSEEDDGQMGKDQEKYTLSLQAGGEEGDEESVKKDTSVRETSYYRNTNSDEDCEKQKLLNSEDEEVQENLKSMGSTFDGKSANQSYSMKSSGDHDDSRFNCSAEENETQCILQVRGEQGEKKDTSDRETINDRNINTGVKCATLSKVKTSGDKEVQDNGFINEDSSHSSSTEENTNEKSEELKETKVDDAPVNVEEQVKYSSDQHLDEETKTERQKQTECQKPAETSSEDLKDEVKEEQGEDIGLEEQKGEEGENNNVCKRDTDDEDNTQMGHSEEDEGQMRKDQEKHAFSLQARGEEGDEESVKKDTSVRETINDRHMSTDEDCEKQNKLINSEDEEVQETLFVNENNTHSSSTEENTNDKSEELMETKVDDAPVNVGEQLNNSSEQHLNEETKTVKQKQTECQKPAETNSEDLTDKVKEEQGEDIGLEEQKGEELENKNVSKRDTDDEENTQIGHSEEDDGQMGKDQEKDTLSLQAGGEEGDEESVKKDTSVRETSYYRNTNSDKDCEKQKLLNSEDEEVQENLKSMGSTFDGKSANQSYSMKSSGDHDDSRFNCSAEENETQCILQVRGEQGEKKDTSDRETINDRNINTGVKCATLSKVKTSGDKEVQDNGFINEDSSHSSSTEENTNEKSEELKETKVDDAPVNVEEQVKYSSDQHLDEETKTERQKQTECQKPAETSSEDLKDEVKEEQGEDIGLEEQKGEEGENNNVSKRDTDDEDNTQMGHSEEDALGLQARGEEGDAESIKKDTSVRETSCYRNTKSDEDREKQKLLNSEDEIQENLNSMGSTHGGKSVSQGETERGSPWCNIWSSLPNFLCFKRSSTAET